LVTAECGWIDIPFSAANFATNGGGTWTVAAANQTTYRFTIAGRTLTALFVIDNSTVTVAGAGQLLIVLPNAYTIRQTHWSTGLLYIDGSSGAWKTPGAIFSQTNGAQLYLQGGVLGVYTWPSGTTNVRGQMTVELN
jgi:hypothetical protein